MIWECCVENMTHVAAAVAAGAGRIELCDNLARGGTSPSPGVVYAAVRGAHARGARVMAMVRPRGGDFCHGDEELDMMRADVVSVCNLGVDGIVFGCLRPRDPGVHRRARAAAIAAGALPGEGPVPYEGGYELDLAATEELASLVRELGRAAGRRIEVTFHMAFDALDPADQPRALDVLAALGIERVLTHGGPAGTPIEGNLGRLRALMAHAGERIRILPGGGITHANRDRVAAALGATELHGTRIVDFATPLAP